MVMPEATPIRKTHMDFDAHALNHTSRAGARRITYSSTTGASMWTSARAWKRFGTAFDV